MTYPRILRVPLVQQQLHSLQGHLSLVLSGVFSRFSLNFLCFVDYCLSFPLFSFRHLMSKFGFWLPHFYLQTFHIYCQAYDVFTYCQHFLFFSFFSSILFMTDIELKALCNMSLSNMYFIKKTRMLAITSTRSAISHHLT